MVPLLDPLHVVVPGRAFCTGIEMDSGVFPLALAFFICKDVCFNLLSVYFCGSNSLFMLSFHDDDRHLTSFFFLFFESGLLRIVYTFSYCHQATSALFFCPFFSPRFSCWDRFRTELHLTFFFFCICRC